MKNSSFSIQCDCHCSILAFNVDEDGCYIEHYESSFYSHQNNWKENLKNKVKFIWMILTGKEFHLYDIAISKAQLPELKEAMRKFIEE